jgi:hypothetical protein
MCTPDYAAYQAAIQSAKDAKQYATAVQKYDSEPRPSSKSAFIENFVEDFSWTHKNPEVAARQAVKQFRKENLEARLR